MRLRRSLLLPALALALTATTWGCSSESADEPDNANEGALTGESLLESVIGEVSKGDTLGADFESKKAVEKQAKLWAAATTPAELRCHLGADQRSGDALVKALLACKQGTDPDDMRVPTVTGTLARATYSIFISALAGSGLLPPAFDRPSNELQAGRKKLLHPFGMLTTVELRVEASSPYSGVLTAGAKVPGVARLSAGAPEKVGGFGPGMGLKLFTDGGFSIDLHALHQIEGQTLGDGKTPDHNYFRHAFSNEIIKGEASGAGAIVEKLFSKVHDPANRLPVDHLGRRTVDGKTITDVKAPKDVSFDPPAELTKATQAFLDANPGKDERIALAAVTKDATAERPVALYKVRPCSAATLAATNPEDVENKCPAVATLYATAAFVPSKFGDAQLLIRHHRGCEGTATDDKPAVEPSLCDRQR